jgi:hypothetical protein
MARFVLIALNGPTPGEGNEVIYNDWYERVHIPDLLATPGVTSARRFKVVHTKTERPWPYLALYEIETDDLAATFKYMNEHNQPFHPTFDRSVSEAITAIAIE